MKSVACIENTAVAVPTDDKHGCLSAFAGTPAPPRTRRSSQLVFSLFRRADPPRCGLVVGSGSAAGILPPHQPHHLGHGVRPRVRRRAIPYHPPQFAWCCSSARFLDAHRLVRARKRALPSCVRLSLRRMLGSPLGKGDRATQSGAAAARDDTLNAENGRQDYPPARARGAGQVRS